MNIHPPSAVASSAQHHTSLHKASATVTLMSNEPMSPAVSALTSNAPPTKCMSMLMATARVMTSDQFGAHHPARALVQRSRSSSSPSVSSYHTAVVEIFSVGRLSSGIPRGHVTLTVSSRFGDTALHIRPHSIASFRVWKGT